MSTFLITLFSGLFSWRFIYPPLALFLFIFLDPMSTLGTAAVMPLSIYTSRMVWGALVGVAIKSLMIIYRTRNSGSGGRYSWRVGVICLLMVIMIRISVIIGTGEFGLGIDYASSGPLTLIIVVAYLRDRRAWLYFGLMLILQLGLGLYIILNPESLLNGYSARIGDLAIDAVNFDKSEIIGSRVQGQFGNTVALAMHAAVGVALGIALLVASYRSRTKRYIFMSLGIVIVIVGLFLLGISMTRGIIIGVIIGILGYFIGIHGTVRTSLFLFTLLSLLYIMPSFLELIPADDPVFGRFVLFAKLGENEGYRLQAIPNSINAVMQQSVFGWGDYESGLNACNGYLAHQGPLAIAVLYGIPVGLLACVILVWAIKSDFSSKKLKVNNFDSEFAALRAFRSISLWAAIACIMTNGYAASALLYIILGVVMWPKIFQATVPKAISGRYSC